MRPTSQVKVNSKFDEQQVVGQRAHVTRIIRESKKAIRERRVKSPAAEATKQQVDLERDLPTHLLSQEARLLKLKQLVGGEEAEEIDYNATRYGIEMQLQALGQQPTHDFKYECIMKKLCDTPVVEDISIATIFKVQYYDSKQNINVKLEKHDYMNQSSY